MAISTAHVKSDVVGARRKHTYDVTFDSSYPTGGEAYTAGNFGLVVVEDVQPRPHTSRIVVDDPTNKKLKVNTGVATEAADTSDQSTITVRVDAWGY